MHTPQLDDARKLEKDLLKRHEGKILDEVFRGETYETSHGSCYKIEESEKFKITCLKQDKARSNIIKDLKVIPGIGVKTELNLREQGYENLEDLLEHPRYHEKAEELLEKLHESPLDCIAQFYSNSHLNMIYSSSFQELDDFIFFDIETLGLKDVPVILIGMARIIDDQVTVTQYLATNLTDEKNMLHCFLQNINKETVFVSFNGRSFDLPYIRGRARYYGIRKDLNRHHLDLLHLSRRAWGKHLPNCRLQTLEKHLFGMRRYEDVPSSEVPAFYKKYLKTGNIGPLIPIVEHNKLDVVTLARILSRLHEESKDKS